jgi:hypothetical protein
MEFVPENTDFTYLFEPIKILSRKHPKSTLRITYSYDSWNESGWHNKFSDFDNPHAGIHVSKLENFDLEILNCSKLVQKTIGSNIRVKMLHSITYLINGIANIREFQYSFEAGNWVYCSKTVISDYLPF